MIHCFLWEPSTHILGVPAFHSKQQPRPLCGWGNSLWFWHRKLPKLTEIGWHPKHSKSHEMFNRFLIPPNCSFGSFAAIFFFRGSDMLRSFCGDPLFGRSCRVCWTKTWPWPAGTPLGVHHGNSESSIVGTQLNVYKWYEVGLTWTTKSNYVINSYYSALQQKCKKLRISAFEISLCLILNVLRFVLGTHAPLIVLYPQKSPQFPSEIGLLQTSTVIFPPSSNMERFTILRRSNESDESNESDKSIPFIFLHPFIGPPLQGAKNHHDHHHDHTSMAFKGTKPSFWELTMIATAHCFHVSSIRSTNWTKSPGCRERNSSFGCGLWQRWPQLFSRAWQLDGSSWCFKSGSYSKKPKNPNPFLKIDGSNPIPRGFDRCNPFLGTCLDS